MYGCRPRHWQTWKHLIVVASNTVTKENAAMARIPVAWMKIYTPSGEYVASCADPAAAAALMAMYGNGAEIRNGHAKKNLIWKEGSEAQPAGESYDYVAQVINERTTACAVTVDPEQDRRVQAGFESAKETVRAMLARLP